MASLALLIKSRTGKSQTFADAAVTAATDIIVLPGHTFATSDLVRLSATAALPAGLVATNKYYVIKVSDGSIKLATTAALAVAGTAVDITAASGGGTHTIRLVEASFADLVGISHGDARKFAKDMADWFLRHAAGAGNSGANIDVSEDNQDPVAAAGTITLTYANLDADDTVTIGGQTITAKASGALAGVQFNKLTDATVTAALLVVAINANTALSQIFTATSVLGVVTLTCKIKGSIGNLIVMSTSDDTAYELVQMVGGTGGAGNTVTNYSLGL